MRPRALVLFAALMLLSCKGKGTAHGHARPPPLVVVSKVETRDMPVEVRAPVDLRPLAQADVTSKTLGYLDAVLVDRGDVVKRGQLLALVRPSNLPDQLAAARGNLAQTDAAVQLAKTNLDRAQQLAPSGVVSQQELQTAQSAYATAQASQDAAKSQVGALAVRLGETRITAPLDGIVSVRRLDPGALVGPTSGGSSIMTIVRVDVLRVFIAIPERQAAGVTVGKDAHVELEGMEGKSLSGKVVRVAPVIDPGTRTFDAEVQLPNPTGELRPGMFGRGAIVKEVHHGVPVIPAVALLLSGEERYVYVLSGDKVEHRTVTTGVDAGTVLEVTSGLKAGDEVVTAGTEGLSPGETVRPVRGVSPYTGTRTDGGGGSGG